MSENVVYEIARHAGVEDEAALVESVQLVSVAGLLKLRSSDRPEISCDGTDVATVLRSTPVLHEVRQGEEARISCAPDVVGELPFVLRAVCDGEDTSDCFAKVNGADWAVFPTNDGDVVLLPGRDALQGPDMDPCWAEYQYGEGEWNPIVGDLSIGMVAPGVAVEYGRYDHGGIGGGSAVAVLRFDDFAILFNGWLRRTDVLDALWGGDSPPGSPNFGLFAEAALVEDQVFAWDTDSEPPEDGADDEDDDEGGRDFRWERLQLHLSAELVDQVRGRASSRRDG